MYNAGKVEALANLKTKTNAFLGTTTNKNGVIFSFWDKWRATDVSSLPSLLGCVLVRAAATQGGDARRDAVTRAQTHWEKAARTATALGEEPDNAAKSNGRWAKARRQNGRDDDSLRPRSTGID